jgi:hypothetical protein
MTTTLTLSEKDITEAVQYWLAHKGYIATRVTLRSDPGDPPLSGPTVYARVELEGK